MRTTTLLKRFFICLTLIVVSSNLCSQTINGKVIDGNTKEPLPFVNVLNLNVNDSTLITGTVTDNNGLFTLSLSQMKSFLRISFIGYNTTDIPCHSGMPPIGDIELMPSEEMLETVVVTGTRQLFKMEQGGISTNVSSDIRLKNLGTAINVLEKLPFVFNDNGKLMIVGKGEPLIYINNRLVRDKNELDQLSSNDIKKAIVITNPGPEYDASVSSVIKIETSRPVGDGFGGEISAMGNKRRKFSHNENISLNYRTGGLDIFGSFFFQDSKEINRKYIETGIEREIDNTVVKQHGNEGINYKYINGNGGFNYIISPEHSLGARYIYTRIPMIPDIDISADVYIDELYYESFRSAWEWESTSNSHLLNAYYNGQITPWLNSKFDFDYSKGNTDHHQIVDVTYQDKNEIVETDSKQDYDLYAGKLTFTTPLSGSNLVYGTEYSHTNNEQRFLVEKNESSGELVSNVNVAKQKLFAAFLSYSKTLGKFSVSAGLRFENVSFNYSANGVTVKEQSKTYKDFFPNAMINYQNNGFQTMLSYRATTNRPSYSSLSNRLQYDGPYLYETGNPFLKPVQVHDISFSALWKDIRFMASYKIYKDKIIYFHQQYESTNISLNKPQNIDECQNLTVSAYYSPTIGIWRPTLGVNMMKDFLEYGIVPKKYNNAYFRFSLQNSIKLNDTFICGIDFRANTKGHESMNYLYEAFSMNINISKTFLNNKLILNMNVTDVLNTDKRNSDFIGQNLYLNMRNQFDSRGIMLSVKYRFNATSNKYKGSSAAGDELRRM